MGRTPKAKASRSPKKAKSALPIKKQKRPKKDPNAPKRGKSAYMFFLAESRGRITKPGMSVIDVTKAAGVEWGTIKDKSKWEKLAAEDKKRYEKECASYKAGIASSSKSKKDKDKEMKKEKEETMKETKKGQKEEKVDDGKGSKPKGKGKKK